MLPIGLNHMTVSRLPARALLDVAKSLGCVGVELRNDLGAPLFDEMSPDAFGAICSASGLRILALAEVKAFNHDTPDRLADAEALIAMAAACGAEGVALIPHVADAPLTRGAQRGLLRDALLALQPVLENHAVRGYIEPLGFVNSSLRHKEDVADVLADLGNPTCFAMIHDTFHHALAGGGNIFAGLTALVHVSGVVDPDVDLDHMTDAHRVLVDARDRLDNIGQLNALLADGYTGPVSFEAFAPEIHAISDPAEVLAGSITFMTSQLGGQTAGAA